MYENVLVYLYFLTNKKSLYSNIKAKYKDFFVNPILKDSFQDHHNLLPLNFKFKLFIRFYRFFIIDKHTFKPSNKSFDILGFRIFS